MAKKAKKTFTRKSEKRYEMITFETPIYEEEFTFPAVKHMSQKLAMALDAGQFKVFYEWLRNAGVSEEEIDASPLWMVKKRVNLLTLGATGSWLHSQNHSHS